MSRLERDLIQHAIYESLTGDKGQDQQGLEEPDEAPPARVFDVQNMQRPCEDETGLTIEQIDAIMPISFDAAHFRPKVSGHPASCNICLVDFEQGTTVKMLQCLHTFHKKCIDEWLAKKSLCPACRFNLRCLDVEQFF